MASIQVPNQRILDQHQGCANVHGCWRNHQLAWLAGSISQIMAIRPVDGCSQGLASAIPQQPERSTLDDGGSGHCVFLAEFWIRQPTALEKPRLAASVCQGTSKGTRRTAIPRFGFFHLLDSENFILQKSTKTAITTEHSHDLLQHFKEATDSKGTFFHVEWFK